MSCIKDSVRRVIEALEQEQVLIDRATDAAIGRSSAWRREKTLLISVPGIEATIARTLIAELPKLGSLNRKQAAALIGLEPGTKSVWAVWTGMDALVPDDLWAMVEPLLPPEPDKPKDGRRRASDRAALAGIILVQRTGMQWKHLPCSEVGCSGKTSWRRLGAWQTAAVWATLHRMMLARRTAVSCTIEEKGYSQRRACGLIGLEPKTYRYVSARGDDGAVRVSVRSLAGERRCSAIGVCSSC
jgi:transposase